MKEELEELTKYINENNSIPLEVKTQILMKLTKYINSIQIKIHDEAMVDIAKRNLFEYFNKKLYSFL